MQKINVSKEDFNGTNMKLAETKCPSYLIKHIHKHLQIHIYMHTYTYTHNHKHELTCMHVCIYIYIYIYIAGFKKRIT